MSNFTVKINPFTGALLTDADTVYVDADTGDDANAGTQASPKKTLNLTLTVAKPNCVARGVFNGNYILGTNYNVKGYLLGDLNTVFTGTLKYEFDDVSSNARIGDLFINNLTVNNLVNGFASGLYSEGTIYLDKCLVRTLAMTTDQHRCFINNSIIENMTEWRSNVSAFGNINNVFVSLRTKVAAGTTHIGWQPTITDSILVDNATIITLGYVYPQFVLNNCIIRKQCRWFYGTVQIPLTWITAGDELTDLKNSLLAFADTASVASGAKDAFKDIVTAIFGTGTTVYDDSSPNVRIFNKYDLADNVLDYSLNMQEGNPALTKSISLGRIGAWFPKYNISFKPAVEITDAGVETGNAGNLLVENDGIFIDLTSSQKRNKMETNVISLPGGDVFKRWQSSFAQSTSSDIYLGAKQILTAGQHPINAILVTPYDTPLLPSSYPKFLAPINSEVELAYLSGSPVLFNDLAGLGVTTNKNLAECGTWAVSNACHEWIELTELPGVTVEHPKFRHFVLTVIANSFA